jgi:hypothetical protein
MSFVINNIKSRKLRRTATIAVVPFAAVWVVGLTVYEMLNQTVKACRKVYREASDAVSYEVIPAIKVCWNKE